MSAGLRRSLMLAVVIGLALVAVMTARADSQLYMYVSMGDSYSAGTGTGPYEDTACHRSPQAWTRYIIQGPYGFDELACAGASIDAFYHKYLGQPAQLDILRDDVARRMPDPSQPWNPRLGTIKLVTVTVGGNDVNFARILAECLALTCLNDGQYKAEKVRIHALKNALVRLYATIKSIVPVTATVLVVGYPRIFPKDPKTSVNCGLFTPLEQSRVNELTSLLDLIEQEAAQAAGVGFVGTFDVLSGHELCTKNPWMVPVGNKPPKYSGGSGHPNRQGQDAIAAAVKPYVPDFAYQPGG